MSQNAETALPLVSVAIPAYNAAASIAETLESLVAQDHPNVEVIVVDDGSRDDTALVAESFAPLVRVVRQKNAGLAAARNTGVREARGHLIALLDADDLAAPERLSTQARVFLQHPEVGLCATGFSAFDSNGTISPSYASRYYRAIRETPGGAGSLLPTRGEVAMSTSGSRATTHRGDAYEHLVKGNFLHPPTVMFRKDLFEKAGPFDPAFRYTSDWEWFVRASRHALVAYVDHPLLGYRISDTQMSGKNRPATTMEFIEVLDKICRLDPELAARPEIGRKLQEFCVEAADSCADDDRSTALALLRRGARSGPITREALRVAAKALLPALVKSRLRVARTRSGRG